MPPAPTFTQDQVTQALHSCCADPAHLQQGCIQLCRELPGVPARMIALAATTIVANTSPAQLAVLLATAGFPFNDVVESLLEQFPGSSLADTFQITFDGLEQAQAPLPERAGLQQGFGDGLAAARAHNPSLSVRPPVPAVTAGAQPRWLRALFDPAMGNANLSLVVGTAGAAVLVANTGQWLTFLDVASGGVSAVVPGAQWMPKVVAGGGMVFAQDAMANVLYALRPDGSEAWSAPLPAGELAFDGGHVFHQSLTDGTITALDAAGGTQTWQVNPMNAPPTWANVAAGAGRVVYIGNEPSIAVHALDAQTGAAAWTWTPVMPPPPGSPPGTPPTPWPPSRWIDGPLTVTTDGVLLAPLLPFIPPISLADGTCWEGVGLGSTNQNTSRIEWATDASRTLAVAGWESSIAFLLNYWEPAVVSWFPDLQTTETPPDPNLNGPTQPRLWNGNLVVTFLAGGDHAEVYLATLSEPMLNSGFNNYPGRELFSIPGIPYSPQLDATTLYLLLGNPNDKSIQYLVALPMT